jgi:PAS domain S-box-containing protein
LIRVTDAGADLAERKLLEQFGQQALLMIPLVAHDRTVGLVQLYENRAEREFTEDHVHLGTALANQAAIAIENSRLYERTDERLQARVDELTALQRVTRELNATLALDHIVDALLDAAIEATGATHGNVLLLDLMSGHLALRAARGYTDEEADSLESTLLDPSSETIVKQIATTGEPRLVEDAEREQVNVCVKPGTRSSLGVPILSEGLVVGVVNLRHMESGAFDRQSLAFVQSRVEQAALAIGNAMRFEEQLHTNETLRTRSEQMASLLEVSRKLRADVSLEETLEEVAYAIQETVGFDIVLVSVCQGVPPVMRRVAMAGLPLHQFESLQQVTQPVERFENLYRDEYRLGPCYFYPFQKRADWEEELHTLVPTAGAEEWREGQWHRHDMLLVPLRGAGGRLLGQISVDQPRDGRRPSRLTLNTLAIFANQAAIAIENANLYADAQRRAENLALINEVGRTLSQVLDPDLVLNTVVRAVCDLLQCTVSAIFQLDRRDGTLAAVASFGVPLSEMGDLRFEPGEGLVGHVATTREPLLLADTAGDPRFVEGPEPIGSMLLVPIMAGGQFMGVLTAGSPHAGALMSADQVLLSTLADQAAVALESARLFDTTQQAALRLSLLNEIGRRAAAELDAQAMLDMAVGALHQNLGFFRVAAFLVDEASDYLYVAAANEGFWPVIPPNYRLAVGEGLIGAAVAGEETVLVNDTAADERYVRAGEWHCAASLSVPIKVRDRVIGVLHTESDRLMAFRDEDAAALEIAADQLAVALQNAQLFDETQRRVAELATINEIGRAISSALDLSELYGLIYLQVSKLLDTRNFHIALLDQATDLIHVEFLVEHGQQQPPVVLASGQGLTGHLIRTGEPILLSYGSVEFLAAHGLSLEREPARSWLGVPMIAEDRPIGAIAVQSFEQDAAFDPGHLELLSTVAGQAAVAVQNALLFRERERRIGELAAVNQMARAISSTLELDELLELVYAQASTLIDTTNFSIALYDEEGDVITFPFVVDPEEREDWAPRKGRRGLTGRIIETGEPLLLPSGAAGPERDEGRAIHAGLCHSWLGVPMIAEDKVRGVIAVQSYDREHVFGRQDLEFLMTVASQSAMAVRNAQLYQQIVRFSSELEEMVEARTRDLEQALDELRVERDRVETLYRITSELGATLELERVLQRALELFAGALDIEHGSILLVDQASGLLNLRATLEEDRQLPQEGKPTRWRHGVGLAGWVLARGEPVLVDDILADDRWVRRPGKELRVRSVMSAPLSLGGGDVLGVITLGHREVGYFTPEHMQLLTAATSQIAIAVNNSDLYAFISDQADQLGSALQAQQEEAAKSRAILESIADGVLVLDDKGRVLLLNPTAEELLGFAAVALEGEHFRHMLGLGETEAHRELAQGLYRELRGQLEVEDDEEHARSASIRLSAGRRVLAVTIAPLILSLGGATGLVAALRDISREAEVERLKNEFISTVSHELRTPMTSIKGYTDLLFLGMAGGLTDAQRNFLQIIKSNADRLTALVNDILDISRIETGRIRLTIEPLDLIELIDQVVASFREQYRDEGMALIWEAPETLPAVRGDAARVTQVLSNLVANAWQYTPYGGEVSISARTVDGFVQVDVADNGIGIAPENIARIFDRFFRADHPMVQEAEGTGLGLSIVKMFVEMLGGEIWVDSTLGAGSTFSFTMPLASTDLPEPDAGLLDMELTPVTARRPKILVVEDDRDLALLLRRQLEADGYQVVLAGTGDDAIWLAREEQPQVITLDIMLPDVDGFVVLERLKDNPLTAAIPVVIASVLSGGAEHKGYSLGAVDYVVKPFAEEELLTAVRRALSTLDSTGAHRVLVVDDDADILALIREALLFHGYQVDTVSDGQAALDRIDQARPDLLLLDIRMPGMDGYDVIRHLKADESTHNIPIIVITASSVDKERDRVRVLGMAADQYMTKPLSIAGLILEIKKAIADGVSG